MGYVRPARDADRRSLLVGYAVSAAGSGVGAGAVPLVAVVVLFASAAKMSLLSGFTGRGTDGRQPSPAAQRPPCRMAS